MTEHTEVMDPEHEAAIQQAMRAVADTMPTGVQMSAAYEANAPLLRPLLGGMSLGDFRKSPAPCHRCDAPATTQWPRHATETEAAQHWDALEQNIRDGGNPDYVADRSDSVVKTVHGCDRHVVDAPHGTHDADCGGHGACECAPAETEPAIQDLGGYAAPIAFDPDGTPHWPANPTS